VQGGAVQSPSNPREVELPDPDQQAPTTEAN
jgi:hypothetical protein